MKITTLRNCVLLFCTLSALQVQAQVTIGSLQPPAAGALLDLKTETDGTSKQGMVLPRVKLESPTKLKMGDNEIIDGTTNEYAKHTGLLVYNTNSVETADRLCPGLHVWDGTKWQPLAAYPDWSATPPTVVGTPLVGVTRTPIVDPAKPIGHVGYLEDIRGLVSDGEYNRYAYARFYLDKLKVKTSTNYTGQKPWGCVAKNEAWTEVIETETLDEGTYMTQNMNTRYFPDNTIINGGVPSGTTVAADAQFCYPSSTGAITKTTYWDRSHGVFYNYKAAVNKDVPDIDEGATDHEVRQGICPTGWHVPSHLEWTAFIAALGGDVVAGTLIMSATRLADADATYVGTSASADMGGFNVLLTGDANNGAAYVYGRVASLHGSSSYNGVRARGRMLDGGNANVASINRLRADQHSVRCKKDND